MYADEKQKRKQKMRPTDKQHRSILQRIAQRVMLEKRFIPTFSDNALAELDKIHAPAAIDSERVRDLNLLWASIS